ncbi:MAG: hypothetical protein KatS3mg129_1998 [Leptospiraceae bacterium]|nr:MAG: hypothetical protein KatS3mg129_1998 [Leptospiraceae bacterium]
MTSIIDRDAKISGMEENFYFKWNFYNNIAFITGIRSFNILYQFKNFNLKDLKNFEFRYIDSKYNPVFPIIDEKTIRYSMQDILLGIEYRLYLL